MSQCTRREFIGAATAGAAALMTTPSSLLAAAYKKCPIGVQLYSVRNDFNKDVPGVLAGIKKIGYEGVEFAGYAGKTAADLRKMLDDNGLKACGSHIQGGLNVLMGDAGFQKEVDFNKTLGNDKLIIAMGNARTVDDWTKMADNFSAVAAKLKPLNLRLGYHNHTAEFTAVDGQIPEYLFFDKAGPDVFVQLDVGHCVHAGGDPIAVIKKYNSRLVSMHIKDWNPATRGDIVGEGSVKWAEVLAACASCPNLQWYNIEEEVTMSGLGSIEKCYQNWVKILAA
ncbi:MAG: sugar phosphate isomerase/epimerase [Verrucomicrobiota bacterium]|jgi:sugar phosphate isomerase/epimerase